MLQGGEILLTKSSRLALDLMQFPIQWVTGTLFFGVIDYVVKLTTQVHLELRLQMHVAVFLVPHMSSHGIALYSTGGQLTYLEYCLFGC
jgi:hypothetical protein